MNTNNLPARSLRHSEVGQVWVEQLSGTTGTVLVQQYASIRVRSVGAGTVTIDGVLAMTMSAGEIVVMNVGNGSAPSTPGVAHQVSVVIGGAGVYLQVGQQVERPAVSLPVGSVVQGPSNS